MKCRRMPPQAQANKMAIPEAPKEIKDLTSFEARLVSKRIPFMKIMALPKGKQRGIVGSVVNVPADIEETCDVLPLTPSSAGFIPVKLKRKQCYKGHVYFENVRPAVVLSALQWLKENNPHYKTVTEAPPMGSTVFKGQWRLMGSSYTKRRTRRQFG